MSVLFVASRGCSSCPYRGTCHEARQRIQDPTIAVGRHYDCEFHRGIQAKRRAAVTPSPRPWWRFALADGGEL
jgi:hypothetical protein